MHLNFSYLLESRVSEELYGPRLVFFSDTGCNHLALRAHNNLRVLDTLLVANPQLCAHYLRVLVLRIRIYQLADALIATGSIHGVRLGCLILVSESACEQNLVRVEKELWFWFALAHIKVPPVQVPKVQFFVGSTTYEPAVVLKPLYVLDTHSQVSVVCIEERMRLESVEFVNLNYRTTVDGEKVSSI